MKLDKRILELSKILKDETLPDGFIKIEKKKAVATNRFILFELPLKEESERDFFIGESKAKELLKSKEVIVEFKDDKILINSEILEQPNFDYPEYKRLYQNEDEVVLKVRINFLILELLVDILQKYKPKKRKLLMPITFTFYDFNSKSAVKFEAENDKGEYIRGLFMPLEKK